MEMFLNGFMLRALIASLLMAVIAPMLGLFLVLRRQSLMADTLSHVSLAGVALGLLLQWNPTITTLIVVVIAAIGIEWLRQVYQTYSEVSIAILMSAGMAMALILMSLNRNNSSTSVQQYLFGSIVAVSKNEILLLLGLFILLLILFALFKKPMYVLTFDEDTAFVDGLPTKFMSGAFNVIAGVSIAVMMPIAGALLVSAIMILPAAIAMRVSKSFNGVMIAGVVIGLIGMTSGLFTSFALDLPTGATITMIFVVMFLILAVFKMIYQRVRKKKAL